MKRVGINTWYIGFNLGAALQAYALNRFLNDMPGVEAEHIQYIEYPRNAALSYVENIRLTLKLKGIKTLPRRIKMIPLCRKKIEKIDLFRLTHMKQTKEITNKDDLKKLNSVFDFFICGSDQIWNPNFLDTTYMLDFTSDSNIRIAYAASIGVTKWPEDKRTEVKPLLDRFKHISLRERSALKVIRDLTTCPDIKHVCDPVLLLTKEKWNDLSLEASDKIKAIESGYIFCYILNKNDKQIELVKKYSEKYNLRIVNLLHPAGGFCKTDLSFGDIKLDAISPQDFVWLVKNADIVLTDSFHCVMFSIIFETCFYCFGRSDYKEMNVRIDSIMETAGLQHCVITEDCNSLCMMDKETVFTDAVRNRINAFRTESINWLKLALAD